MTTTFAADVPRLLHRVQAATVALRSSDSVPAEVEDLVEGLDDDLHAAAPQQLDVDPYLAKMLLAAGWRASKALRHDDADQRRRDLRIALEQVRQTLRDIETGAGYDAEVPAKQLVRRLAEELPVPQAQLASLLAVSPRQLQRWLSPTGPGPVGEDDARLRAVARIVSQLRHTFTPPGIVAWFSRVHPRLDERPVDVLEDPLRHPELVALARSARTTTA